MTVATFISIGECMAELQLARDGLYSLGFGGDTLNTAWYMRALTDSGATAVEYFTAVGSDQLSKNLLGFLKENGLGTRFIAENPDLNLGLYLITLAGTERSFTYWRSASAARLLAEDERHLRSALSQADTIYFSGITLAILSPPHRRTFLTVLREMKSLGLTIVFDSNARRKLWPTQAAMKKAVIAGYRVATRAMPTFDDDSTLFGDADPAACARRIAGLGVSEVVVKNGSEPCTILAKGELSTVESHPVSGIVDTTGAGDSFNAGYMAARMAGKLPGEAAAFAHRVAARVICGRGALLDMAKFSDLRVR
jgi:2-dehydro-3-deoxygluconokinase